MGISIGGSVGPVSVRMPIGGRRRGIIRSGIYAVVMAYYWIFKILILTGWYIFKYTLVMPVIWLLRQLPGWTRSLRTWYQTHR